MSVVEEGVRAVAVVDVVVDFAIELVLAVHVEDDV